MKLIIKHLMICAIAIIFNLKSTSESELNKKIHNPGNNAHTNRMNTERLISRSIETHETRSAPRRSQNIPEYEEIKRNAIITHTIYLSPIKNITLELNWNKTEIPSLNLILKKTNGNYLKDENKSQKDVSVKKSMKGEIASEIVNIGKIKNGTFSLYMKLMRPKNSIQKANVTLIIKDNENKVTKFRLKEFFPHYWYFGLFDYDHSKFIATSGEIMDLKEIDKEVNKYMTGKKKKENKDNHVHPKKSPIRKIEKNSAKSKHNYCPSEKQIVMKWLKNLLTNMFLKSKNLKSFVNKGFESETSFLQKTEKNIDANKIVPKKVRRLLLIFPLRRIIILRGKKLINRIKSLPAWKKRIFIRMMRYIIMRTIRTNRIRRMKIGTIFKIRNLIKKLQQAKLKKKKKN